MVAGRERQGRERCRSVARHLRIDFQRPGVDAACKRCDLGEPGVLQAQARSRALYSHFTGVALGIALIVFVVGWATAYALLFTHPTPPDRIAAGRAWARATVP